MFGQNKEKHKNRRIDTTLQILLIKLIFRKIVLSLVKKILVLNDILLILKSEENMKIEIGICDKGTGDDFLNDNISNLRNKERYIII